MPLAPRVLILHNTPQATGAAGGFVESEAGVLVEVHAVAEALTALKIPHRSMGVAALAEVPGLLACSDETLIFNLVEGLPGSDVDANLTPALCRSAGKAYTGNDTASLLATLDKGHCKAILEAAGLPCPAGVVVMPGHAVPRKLFKGPFIVKPIRTDASEGIDDQSIVAKAGVGLTKAVRRVHDQLKQPALIEQFIDGRELNISVIWRKGLPEILPLAQIDFSAFAKGQPKIVGYDAKWRPESFAFNNTPRIIPAPLSAKVAGQVRQLAVEACRALGCCDYTRVDFRLDQQLRPYILEVNANPDISPDAGFVAALTAGGITYKQFVRLCLDNALGRVRQAQIKTAPRKKTAKKGPPTAAGDIRWTEARDRDAVMALLAGTQFFRNDEMVIAVEVLDAALKDGPAGHYQSFVIEDGGQVAGWVCYGPTPCTLGTYDIYWIAVGPQTQGRGLGKRLMDFTERQIAARGGRLAVAETSGRQGYTPTRRFYEKLGYLAASAIKDFYAPGDDKVVYTKSL